MLRLTITKDNETIVDIETNFIAGAFDGGAAKATGFAVGEANPFDIAGTIAAAYETFEVLKRDNEDIAEMLGDVVAERREVMQ